MDTHFNHCFELIKQRQPDHYIALLFMPESARAPLAVLFAFHNEITAIRDVVKEPAIGEIRLQWWLDVLLGKSPACGAPVAYSLNEVIDEFQLPKESFENLLQAHIFDMYSDLMPSLNDAHGYAGETYSAIYQLSAHILKNTMKLDEFNLSDVSDISGHAGVAEYWIKAAALMPIHRARGQNFASKELLDRLGIDREDYFNHHISQKPLKQLRLAMIEQGENHLKLASQIWQNVPKTIALAFLPLATAPIYKKIIKSRKLSAHAVVNDINPLARLWRTYRMSRGVFSGS